MAYQVIIENTNQITAEFTLFSGTLNSVVQGQRISFYLCRERVSLSNHAAQL